MKKEQGPNGLQISEEAVALLRRTPIQVWLVYYVGSVPFVLLFVTFWSETAYGYSMAEWRNQLALGLAVTFMVMKFAHARFTHHLLALIENRDIPPLNRGGAMRLFISQAWIQATGLILLPLATLLAFPFAWVYAFYQNVTILDQEGEGNSRTLIKEAIEEAQRWPKQNHILIWLLTPCSILLLGLITLFLGPLIESLMPEAVAIHAGILMGVMLLLMLPAMPVGGIIYNNLLMGTVFTLYLFKTFFNVEHQMVNVLSSTENPILMLFGLGATYLILDPAMKAAYTLRCFYGRTRTTGQDLRIRFDALKATKTMGLILLLGLSLLGAMPVMAQGTALDEAIDAELEHPRYLWKAPNPGDIEDIKFIGQFLQTVADWIESALQWIAQSFSELMDWIFSRDREPSSSSSWSLMDTVFNLRFLMIVLVVLLVGTILYLVYKHFQNRDVAQEESVALSASSPDLEEETTTADQLPEEGWLALAQEMAAQGNYRLAMRAYFLATLAHLGEANFIVIALFKSNWDYGRELQRRVKSHPDLVKLYGDSMRHYEAVWYGDHEATAAGLERLRHNQGELQRHGTQ